MIQIILDTFSQHFPLVCIGVGAIGIIWLAFSN